MIDFFENLELDPRHARDVLQGFCVLVIAGTSLYHVYFYYGGILGCVFFIALSCSSVYLAEENFAHEYINNIGRFAMVAVVLAFTIYVGGIEMTPVALILLAMFGAIEFLYKVYETLMERINRLEDDVNFLYDENEAAHHDDDEPRE